MRGPGWTNVLTLSVLAAGCAGAPADDDGPGTPGDGPDACPIEYPDGDPFDCDNSTGLAPVEATQPPALTSGWSCLTHYEDTDPDLGMIESYRHQDGRIALYWELEDFEEPGHTFVQGTLYFGNVSEDYEHGGTLVVAPFQPSGLMVFPEVPPGDSGSATFIMRHFQLDVRDTDGSWSPVDDPTFRVGRLGGDAWYAVQYNTSAGARWLDMMDSDPDDSLPRLYAPGKQFFEYDDGTAIYADTRAWGIKYSTYSFTAQPDKAYGCAGSLPTGATL